MVPVRSLVRSKVSLMASNEPAKYVLARVLAAVFAAPNGESVPASYHMLFDPMNRQYVFNVHVQNPSVKNTPPPPPAAPPADSRQRLRGKSSTKALLED